MIKDFLENSNLYYNLSPNIKTGLEWLKKQDLLNIKPSKYLIDGSIFYANVQIYDTKTDAKFEAHRKYIDIQYMIQGEELIEVCNIKNCTAAIEYDLEKDIEFLDCKSHNCDKIALKEGEFAILYPQDAHKPSINLNGTLNVKKVVVKVPIN